MVVGKYREAKNTLSASYNKGITRGKSVRKGVR